MVIEGRVTQLRATGCLDESGKERYHVNIDGADTFGGYTCLYTYDPSQFPITQRVRVTVEVIQDDSCDGPLRRT